MQLQAAARRVWGLWEVRFYERQERDRAIARRAAGKLFVELRDEKTGRRNPGIVRVERGPLPVGVLGEEQQMQRLFGEQHVRFVALLELHRLVPNAQRAHPKLAEIPISRRAHGRAKQHERHKKAAQRTKSPKTIRFSGPW
jgi:hypothetical protein